jgi:glyoxylase I family protein
MSTPDFTFEHAALNLRDNRAAEQWYVRNLGFRNVRTTASGAVFLADPTGRVVLELYSNPAAPVLDFASQKPLSLHFAFLVDDPAARAESLVKAGAVIAEPLRDAGGDQLLMLRDPFGVCIQLIKRKTPMF